MADKKKARRGGGPGRGSERDEEKARRAKRRAVREAAVIGDLSERVNRDCVYKNRERVRAEVLVYSLRQLIDNQGLDKTFYEACSEALMGRVEPGVKRPRAARMVNALIINAFSLSGLPRDEREFRRFFSAAISELWKGVASLDPFWEQRFGLRLKTRLLNVITQSYRSEKQHEVPLTDGMLNTLPAAATSPGPTEENRQRAMDALRRAIARLGFPLSTVYEVDNVGRIIAVRDAAERLNMRQDRIKKLRSRARELLRRDSVLLRELAEEGFVFRPRQQ